VSEAKCFQKKCRGCDEIETKEMEKRKARVEAEEVVLGNSKRRI
jgi:hypothetical protein